MKLVKTIALLFVLTTAQTHAFPIQQIGSTLTQIKRSGQTPIAVFDLDETLIHSAKRRAMAYIKAIERNPDLSAQWPTETRIAYEAFTARGESLIRPLDNQYDEIALFRKVGITTQAFVKTLCNRMLPIYLSDEFIYLDSAYRGAIQLLDLVYRLQGKVYFVTARSKSTQYEGTVRNLEQLHFLRGPSKSFVVLKNDGESSLDFKKRAFDQINLTKQRNEVVALVGENEAENLNAMTAAFPQAISVFVEGATLNPNAEISGISRPIRTKNFVQD